jgi:hypothetical protein
MKAYHAALATPNPPKGYALKNQHRIPKTVEPITLPGRLGIGLVDQLLLGKRANAHQQRRLGEMEVGDHRVHRAKDES